MALDPMARDIEPAADPDLVALDEVVEEFGQSVRAAGPAGDPAMKPDRHHPRRGLALVIELVEAVLEIGEEVIAGADAAGESEFRVVGVERVGDDEMRLPRD